MGLLKNLGEILFDYKWKLGGGRKIKGLFNLILKNRKEEDICKATGQHWTAL
jgi:hypothetical protein